MLINGREYKFLMTVGASAEISDLCPEGDLSRMGDLFQQPFGKQIRAISKIAAALSRGYEENRKFDHEDHEPHALTVQEVMSLDMTTYRALTTEIMKAFTISTETTVQTEESKKNKVAE